MKKSVKIIAFLILLPFSFSALSFAGESRILSDYELDQIHAGGLNLDFDSFLGSFTSTSDTVSKGGVSDMTAGLSSPIVVNSAGSKVQIVEIKTPKVPTMATVPNAPTAPKAPNASSLPEVPSVPETPTVPEVNLALATIPEATMSVVPDSTVVDMSLLAVSTATSDLNNIPQTPVVTAVFRMPQVRSQLPRRPMVSDVTVLAAPDVSSAAKLSENTVTPNVPTMPTAPTAPTAPGVRFDVVAGQNNGKFSVAVSDQSATSVAAGTPIFTASSPGSQNYLNVTDTAQQNLEALININSAGSVIPVQLNLTVLINSNVGTMNLSNNLDLSSFATYQFQ